MAQLVDQAILDDRGYLVALKRIDTNVTKMTKDAEKGFEDVAKSAKVSGAQIGAISGVVSSLVTEFINLGKAGIDALINISKESVQTATEMDTLKARLGGIFRGSKEAADQAFNFIQKKSKDLGIDLSELAGAFIPKTENLAQFERVAKIATALARSDPEQGAIGARIALIEALSGTFTSLQRRFEIPKEDIDTLKEAFDTGGIEDFLTKFEIILGKAGKGFDDLKNTAQTSFDKAAIAGQQFLGQLGTPIVAELKKQFDDLNNTLTENGDDLAVIADAFGRVLANVVDFIGTGINNVLANLDAEQVTRIAEKFFDITEKAKLLVETLSGADVSKGLIDGIEKLANKLDSALTTAIQLNALSEAGAAKAAAEYKTWADEMERLHGEGTLTTEALQQLAGIPGVVQASNDLAKLIGDEEAQALAAKAAAAGQAAYNKVILDASKGLNEAAQRSAENRDATDDLKDSLAEAASAGTDKADAILAAAAADRQAAEDAEKLTEAQDKVNEKMAEAEKDFQRKLEDIDIQTERKRLDIAIEFAQKREDAARQNLQKLEDIQRGYAQDVDDAARDLSRKEEDIARKFGQERIDLERENRQKRLDVEKEYRRTLKDIQRQFLLDADEAEQKRDAVAFLRALKERNNKVQEAQINRQQEITDQRTTNQQKLDELRIQQQRELEEARIANERKLEDLRINLDRQIEAQNIAYSRQLEEIATGEQRKNEELARWREQEIQDAKTAYDRKLADLKASLEAELALVEEYAAKLAEAQARATAAAQGGTTFNPRYANAIVPAGTSHGPGGRPAVTPSRTRSIYGYASGGNVPGGLPIMVGERGPELFVPAQSGAIVPNSALVGPTFNPPQAINNISNVRGGATISVPDAAGLLGNPVAVRQIRNIVLQMLGEAT